MLKECKKRRIPKQVATARNKEKRKVKDGETRLKRT
jgi:hypothetical protein